MTLKKYILKEIEQDYNIDSNVGYHITSRSNLPKIKQQGLVPKVSEDYGEYGDQEGIYFFKSKKHAEDALMNWLGERIEEWEEETGNEYDEVLLVVDLSDVTTDNFIDGGEDQFEYIITEPIPYNKIIKIEEI